MVRSWTRYSSPISGSSARVTIFGTNQAGNFLNIDQCWGDKPVTELSLRPGKIVSNFDHLYPDAYKHLDEFLDKRNEMRDEADWCSSLLEGLDLTLSRI